MSPYATPNGNPFLPLRMPGNPQADQTVLFSPGGGVIRPGMARQNSMDFLDQAGAPDLSQGRRKVLNLSAKLQQTSRIAPLPSSTSFIPSHSTGFTMFGSELSPKSMPADLGKPLLLDSLDPIAGEFSSTALSLESGLELRAGTKKKGKDRELLPLTTSLPLPPSALRRSVTPTSTSIPLPPVPSCIHTSPPPSALPTTVSTPPSSAHPPLKQESTPQPQHNYNLRRNLRRSASIIGSSTAHVNPYVRAATAGALKSGSGAVDQSVTITTTQDPQGAKGLKARTVGRLTRSASMAGGLAAYASVGMTDDSINDDVGFVRKNGGPQASERSSVKTKITSKTPIKGSSSSSSEPPVPSPESTLTQPDLNGPIVFAPSGKRQKTTMLPEDSPSKREGSLLSYSLSSESAVTSSRPPSQLTLSLPDRQLDWRLGSVPWSLNSPGLKDGSGVLGLSSPFVELNQAESGLGHQEPDQRASLEFLAQQDAYPPNAHSSDAVMDT
ncbi:hypothetical protein [Phaffia rhodozyma]|uniref:Uncharacterized protein n=1 Tax=Phaffia rhodozyma TaxID=264483 RepID=A0A0F7SWT3_PHARH|nr:hypothetical protein [Phaffia rhodozyma]